MSSTSSKKPTNTTEAKLTFSSLFLKKILAAILEVLLTKELRAAQFLVRGSVVQWLGSALSTELPVLNLKWGLSVWSFDVLTVVSQCFLRVLQCPIQKHVNLICDSK